jgi:hypothetical protein
MVRDFLAWFGMVRRDFGWSGRFAWWLGLGWIAVILVGLAALLRALVLQWFGILISYISDFDA